MQPVRAVDRKVLDPVTLECRIVDLNDASVEKGRTTETKGRKLAALVDVLNMSWDTVLRTTPSRGELKAAAKAHAVLGNAVPRTTRNSNPADVPTLVIFMR